MSLTHAPHDGLFYTVFDAANLLFGTMSNATSCLHSHLGTSFKLTPLPRWAMGTAKSRLLDIFGAAWMGASLTLRTMGDAKASLDNTVGAFWNGALAS